MGGGHTLPPRSLREFGLDRSAPAQCFVCHMKPLSWGKNLDPPLISAGPKCVDIKRRLNCIQLYQSLRCYYSLFLTVLMALHLISLLKVQMYIASQVQTLSRWIPAPLP